MRTSKTSPLTDEDLKRAIKLTARIIMHHGDAYWPILERLEAEYDKRLTRHKKLKQYSDEHDP